MPDADEVDNRAFWVAALINPLPALGVALEVRPSVLAATSSLARIEVVKRGLIDSIARLKRPGPTF
jgi:hypothetical protein